MATEPGAFLRLKAAIDATIAGMTERTLAAKALTDAYSTFRAEALRVAHDEGVAEEFERLFPQCSFDLGARPSSAGFDPVVAASAANEAVGLLARLSGWLDGFVQAIRMAEEAEAYATARQREQR